MNPRLGLCPKPACREEGPPSIGINLPLPSPQNRTARFSIQWRVVELIMPTSIWRDFNLSPSPDCPFVKKIAKKKSSRKSPEKIAQQQKYR
jgi:hypothetical protein